MDRFLATATLLLTLIGCQAPQAGTAWEDQVQGEITRHIVIRDEQKVRSLIPYESITVERGPCFGRCPVYRMTLNRDGTALLVTDHMLPDKALRYSTNVNLKDYARIAQLVEVARNASEKREYIGQWTDDYSVKITANDARGSWSVTDYGQVAPPEVWALEQIMFGMRSSLPWAGGVE